MSALPKLLEKDSNCFSAEALAVSHLCDEVTRAESSLMLSWRALSMSRAFSIAVLILAAAGAWLPSSSAEACGKCKNSDCCGPVCCYNPCIKYVDATRCCKCCDEGAKIQAVLQVKDPCTCCLVDVPVCIPACCTGEPCIDSKCGALGNGKIFYTWPSGYELKVVLNKRGNITVIYLGK